jgi:hypothetical protein
MGPAPRDDATRRAGAGMGHRSINPDTGNSLPNEGDTRQGDFAARRLGVIPPDLVPFSASTRIAGHSERKARASYVRRCVL